jgi:hypothetical protein
VDAVLRVVYVLVAAMIRYWLTVLLGVALAAAAYAALFAGGLWLLRRAVA